jgi:hypothetical protein
MVSSHQPPTIVLKGMVGNGTCVEQPQGTGPYGNFGSHDLLYFLIRGRGKRLKSALNIMHPQTAEP